MPTVMRTDCPGLERVRGADQRRQGEAEDGARRHQQGNQRRYRHVGDVGVVAEAPRQHRQRRGECNEQQAERRPACRHIVSPGREGSAGAGVQIEAQWEPRGVTHLPVSGL